MVKSAKIGPQKCVTNHIDDRPPGEKVKNGYICARVKTGWVGSEGIWYEYHDFHHTNATYPSLRCGRYIREACQLNVFYNSFFLCLAFLPVEGHRYLTNAIHYFFTSSKV